MGVTAINYLNDLDKFLFLMNEENRNKTPLIHIEHENYTKNGTGTHLSERKVLSILCQPCSALVFSK